MYGGGGFVVNCVHSCNPMDCRLPGFFVPGISQEEYWSGILEWFPPFPLLNARGDFSPVCTESTRVLGGKSHNIVGAPSD